MSPPAYPSEIYVLPPWKMTANVAAAPAETSLSLKSGEKTKSSLNLTAEQAVEQYGQNLSEEQKQELLQYPKVYYMGPTGESEASENNKDKEPEPDKAMYLPKPGDQIAYRYEVEKLIGKGSFANVVRAYDHQMHRQVAVKLMRNEPRYMKLLNREIEILEHMRKQDPKNTLNIIHLLDKFWFRGHLCLSFELLSINLFDLNRKNKFMGFVPLLARKFAHGILTAMDALHVNKIIHADLKPENILLKRRSRSGLKIIDFGWSSFQHQKPFSSYIQSRFYRAPEITLHGPYTTAIDMWSFGTILAEMITGLPLFPGEDKHDQLSVIVECLGVPPTEFLAQCQYTYRYFSPHGYPFYCTAAEEVDDETETHMVVLAGSFTEGQKFRGPPGSKALSEVLRAHYDEALIDLLTRCLEWDPARRITPSEALNHKWMQKQECRRLRSKQKVHQRQ